MTWIGRRTAPSALALLILGTVAIGCELIATVDRGDMAGSGGSSELGTGGAGGNDVAPDANGDDGSTGGDMTGTGGDMTGSGGDESDAGGDDGGADTSEIGDAPADGGEQPDSDAAVGPDAMSIPDADAVDAEADGPSTDASEGEGEDDNSGGNSNSPPTANRQGS
jgi:hypothetical protein